MRRTAVVERHKHIQISELLSTLFQRILSRSLGQRMFVFVFFFFPFIRKHKMTAKKKKGEKKAAARSGSMNIGVNARIIAM